MYGERDFSHAKPTTVTMTGIICGNQLFPSLAAGIPGQSRSDGSPARDWSPREMFFCMQANPNPPKRGCCDIVVVAASLLGLGTCLHFDTESVRWFAVGRNASRMRGRTKRLTMTSLIESTYPAFPSTRFVWTCMYTVGNGMAMRPEPFFQQPFKGGQNNTADTAGEAD